jgi:hypothetical protein
MSPFPRRSDPLRTVVITFIKHDATRIDEFMHSRWTDEAGFGQPQSRQETSKKNRDCLLQFKPNYGILTVFYSPEAIP